MLWHLLQNSWQELLFGRELIERGHCISWKWQSPCTRMQQLWRDGWLKHSVSFLKTAQGHSSSTGIVLRDLLRPVGAAFLGKGTEYYRTLIWSSCQSLDRNTVMLIWQKTLQQPDHRSCCVSGHSHSAGPGTLWGKNKNIYQYYQNHSGTSTSPRFLRGMVPWPILEILFCTLKFSRNPAPHFNCKILIFQHSLLGTGQVCFSKNIGWVQIFRTNPWKHARIMLPWDHGVS